VLEQIDEQIHELTNELLKRQSKHGYWCFSFESGTLTDSLMILLMKGLQYKDRFVEKILLERIASRQTPEGTWKLYPDEPEGNLSETVFSSLALLYSGTRSPNDPMMQRAKAFVRSQSGKEASLTKVVLSLLGHLDWRWQVQVPIEFLLLPLKSPIDFFDFVGYTRVHLAPILVLSNCAYTIHLPGKEKVSSWLPASFGTQRPTMTTRLLNRTLHLGARFFHPRLGNSLRAMGFQYAERFMLNRIEPDGTLYSYFTSTFFMIFALRALGYPLQHPVIQRALQGSLDLISYGYQGAHIQETTSTVWDTALIADALQEAGVPCDHPAISASVKYLLKMQQTKWGDWIIRNRGVLPGGWGFSHSNTINPDVDDTSAALRAIAPTVAKGKSTAHWFRGVDWLISMQNDDGGWPAFEKNTDSRWVKLLPYRDTQTVATDPSMADLTGRTLEFLGKHLGYTCDHPVVGRAVQWLIYHQKLDGSWFGRWGISYIYGTWAALTGLAAVRFPCHHPMVRKAIDWLQSIQNEDGGWGESCQSNVLNTYVPLGTSTLTQTAWALDALIAYHDHPTPTIKKGMAALLKLLQKTSWTHTYPTGAGLADQFYIYYHSYNYIWPLLTLAHYRKKYRDCE
jgi:sporulenol synthase